MANAPMPVEVFVARQPIYDSAMAVTAYELLYRHSPRSLKAEITDPERATLHVIANAALEIGFERLAGGLPIHINYPEVPAKPAVIEGIKTLRTRGHRIALDDYSPRTTDPKLLELADIAKLEITQIAASELPALVKDLKARKLSLIAEQVETLEQFEQCIALGFDGFQGNFLQHPQTFRAKRVPSSRLGTLRLVASLQNEDYSLDEVENLLSQNVSVSTA